MMTRGYHKIVLCNGKTKKQFGVHRLVAQHFIPNPYNKPFVNHINCVKTDNNVENLEWVTEKENVKHAKENGLYHKGEEHYRTKLTEKDVIAIRRLGVVRTQTELAKCFNVQPSTIGKIVRRERWKHIQMDLFEQSFITQCEELLKRNGFVYNGTWNKGEYRIELHDTRIDVTRVPKDCTQGILWSRRDKLQEFLDEWIERINERRVL